MSYIDQKFKNYQITGNNCHVYSLQCIDCIGKRVKTVNFDQEEFKNNSTPIVTITYSGNPPPNNNTLVYTNAKPAHSYGAHQKN